MKIPDIFLSKTWCAFAIGTLLLLPLCALAGTARIESGHSAMWIDPSRNGEGWILEILPNDTAALYWYTSDDKGKPRWIISHAPIVHGEDGDKIIYNELVTGHGGHFGPDYDPDDVTLENVGSAELSFSDCNTGQISFNAYGKTGTYPLTRLTRTMAAGCAPAHGIPGEPVQPHAGTSGTWYDPDNTGQAFTLQWLADGAPILFWFAYDPEGNPFWMAGLGQYEDGRIVFPQLDSVQGGKFGEDYPSEQATLVPWGRLELELTCEGGTATYEATAEGFGSGSFNLVPLTRLAKPACPWVKPKLTDLYDITLIRIPDEPAGPPQPNHWGSDNIIFHDTVSDTGAVAGRRRLLLDAGASVRYQLAQWRPGLSSWETPTNAYILDTAFISSDENRVLISAGNGHHPNFTKIKPTFFQGGVLEPLSGMADFTIHVRAASRNLAQVAGTIARFITLPNGDTGWREVPWVWSAAFGQVELPLTDEVPDVHMIAVSNDGRTAIGTRYTFIENP